MERDNDQNAFGPFFTTDDKDIVVLGRYSNSARPAVFYRKNEYGGIDAFSAAAPVPYYVLRELYRQIGVFTYMDEPETCILTANLFVLIAMRAASVRSIGLILRNLKMFLRTSA